jgi:hypothetical protein
MTGVVVCKRVCSSHLMPYMPRVGARLCVCVVVVVEVELGERASSSSSNKVGGRDDQPAAALAAAKAEKARAALSGFMPLY